jgi:acyl-coenzyme A synthetase/AMP-(fatty) acid ligase
MNKPLYNVAFEVVNHLAENPNRAIFEIDDKYVSGRMFRNMIINFALHMRDRGVTQSSCVALELEDIVAATAFTVAIGLIGCKWVRATLDISKVDLGITHIIHQSEIGVTANIPVIKFDETWYTTPKNVDLKFSSFKDFNKTWMIAQSSGTTGDSKFMNISYKNYWHRVNDIKILDGIKKAFCLYMPLKSSTQYRLITYILNNIPIVPYIEYEKLSKYDGLLITGSLGQILGYIRNKEPNALLDITVDVAGAATSKTDAEKLLKHFKKLRLCYGATETSRTCMKTITNIDQYNGSVGKPFNDVKLKISDGMVKIKTTRNISSEWFLSGDLGYIENGELYITGRKNEQFNIGGVKIDPSIIDSFIKSIDGVEDCLTFQNTELDIKEQLSVLVVGTATNIFEPCATTLGISKTPKNVYYVNIIPKNENGKASRKDALKAIENIEPIKYQFS